jgi:hypothetical protein
MIVNDSADFVLHFFLHPHKLLLKTYVANLAAFLTLSSTKSVDTIEGAIKAGYTICAHGALQNGEFLYEVSFFT